MKKDSFCVRCRPGLPMTTGTVTGYTYTLSGFRFGFTRQNYLGSDCGKWYSVELTTGYIVQRQTYSTLKSAEARNYQLSVDTIEHICKGLDMPLRDFFPAPERSDNS